MNPISNSNRKVANIAAGDFEPRLDKDGDPRGEVLQVDDGECGHGFHACRMAPGISTWAHLHAGDEELFLVEGGLTDHDGHECRPGDIVCLASGAKHNSSTKNGCALAVMPPDAESL